MITLHGLDQVLWPEHCVQDTHGADLCADLMSHRIDAIVRKGNDVSIDSYSGFFDNGHRRATGLTDLLRSRGVKAIDMMGLATDYCVKFTALDAVQEGFQTRLILEGCRGVDLEPGDSDRAIQEMKKAGVEIQAGWSVAI